MSKYLIKAIYILLFLSLSIQAQNVKRIVSLAPSLTQNLYFLGAKDLVVGVTSYCEIAKNDHKENVASAIKVNIEKVVSLKPDLVVTTQLTDPETINMLKKFGLRVEVFGKAHSYQEICNQFTQLGKLIGKQSEAQEVINNTKQRLEKEKQKVPKGKSPRIFFQIGAKPIFTVIPNTFMDDLITFAGGINIAKDLDNASITRESVIVRNPDVILIVTMGVMGDEEKKVWEGYKNMSAIKHKKVFIIDADKACTPTPITFIETLEEMIRLIYN